MMRRRLPLLATALSVMALLLTSCADATPEAPPQPTLNAAEREAMFQLTADQGWEQFVLATFPDAQRPEVQRVRVIRGNESAETQVACLAGKGFKATFSDGDGVHYDVVPEEQNEALHIAIWACGVEYPIEPNDRLPFTEEEARYIHAYRTGDLTECLEAEGFTISTPPSRGTFVDAFLSGGPTWSPYDAVDANPYSELIRLYVECPHVPRGFRGN